MRPSTTFFLLFILLPSLAAHAQAPDSSSSRISVGPFAGGIISWLDEAPLGSHGEHDITRADLFGFGYEAGISARYRIGSRTSLRIGLGYLRHHLSAHISSIMQTELYYYDGDSSSDYSAPALAEVDVEADLDMLQISLAGIFDLVRSEDARISLLAGPGAGIVLSEHRRETVALDTPINVRFQNRRKHPTESNGRLLVAYDSDFDTGMEPLAATRLGLLAGMQCEMLISDRLSFQSSVEYDLPLTFITDPAAGQSIHALHVQAALQWHLE